MKQMVQLQAGTGRNHPGNDGSSTSSTSPSILGRTPPVAVNASNTAPHTAGSTAPMNISRPGSASSLKRAVSMTLGSGPIVKGASYSHTDLLSLQSRSSSPIPQGVGSGGGGGGSSAPRASLTKHDRSSKLTNLLNATDDDWASDMDDSHRAAARRQASTLIKSIEYRPQRTPTGLSSPGGSTTSLNRSAHPAGMMTNAQTQTTINAQGANTSSAGDLEGTSFAPLKKTHSFPQYPAGVPQGGVRTGWRDILEDPVRLLDSRFLPVSAVAEESGGGGVGGESDSVSVSEEALSRQTRIGRFRRILSAAHVDLGALRKLAWNGVPEELRACVWPVLLGHVATHADRRKGALARKRQEYLDGVAHCWRHGVDGLDPTIWHQIHIDVPRTNPLIRLYQYPTTQRALERILYLWAVRHPASGYVQGINDLATPFFQVFLSSYLRPGDAPELVDPATFPKECIDAVEADTFWCLSKLLDGIQDNYIHAQPGIVRQVGNLRELTSRIDMPLVRHLDGEGVEFMQFAFRWINCLLMRELSVRCTTRMWDTYMAEGPLAFSDFHLYVCTALLVKYSKEIQARDFQNIIILLQALPTAAWTDKEIEMLLSEAYLWKSLWSNSPQFTTQARSGR
ncbi:GTPase-activating protein [Savitreella phatthalungensis]